MLLSWQTKIDEVIKTYKAGKDLRFCTLYLLGASLYMEVLCFVKIVDMNNQKRK